MSWYYCREPGDEGQILTDEGTPPGVALPDLLDRGALPVRAALELVASVADAVSIAEEDRALHGDLKPGSVYVDASGAVSVSGYGEQRRGGRAPEGRVVGIGTDIYGLGIIMYAVMSGGSMGQIPRDRDGHDDHVVGRLLEIDWGALADKGWMQEVQSFLCSMLAYEPAERPAPLDVANVLFHVASQAPGKDLPGWAARAVPAAGGERAAPSPGRAAEEDLGGPQAIDGPAAPAGLKVRQAASAKGESTAFWSRERIAAMLAEEEDDDPADAPVRQAWSPGAAPSPPPTSAPSRPPRGPTPPSGSAFDAPEPAGIGGPPPVPPQPDRSTRPPRDLAPPPTIDPPQRVPQPPLAHGPDSTVGPGDRVPPPPAPPRPRAPEPEPQRTPPAAAPPEPPGPPPGGPPATPFAIQGPTPGQPVSAPPGEKKKGGGLKIALALIAVLILFCGGGGAVGALFWFQSQQDGGDQVEVGLEDLEDRPTLDDVADTGAAEEDEPEAPAQPTVTTVKKKEPTTSSKGSSSSSSSTKKSSSSSSSTTTKKAPPPPPPPPEPEPEPEPEIAPTPTVGGPFAVRFIVDGAEATVECGDSQRATFAGTTQMRFQTLTTCRVLIDGQLGAIQVSEDATVKCTPSGGRVMCAPQ